MKIHSILRRFKSVYSAALGNMVGDYNHLQQPVGRFISAVSGRLGGYYNDLTGKALDGEWSTERLDAFLSRPPQRHYFSATAVAHMGLGWYDLWLETGRELNLNNAVVAAEWLLQTGVTRSGAILWLHGECPDLYRGKGLPTPWFSAMTQGEAISLLLRCHQALASDRYLEAATQAFQVFRRPLEKGGVVTEDGAGHIFFEEYPHGRPYSHVLNGHIYALWGVYDFALYTQDSFGWELYDQAVADLRITIEQYDTGYWSRYDLYPAGMINVSSPFYHRLHCSLLEALAVTSGVGHFAAVAERWRAFQRSRWSTIRAATRKALFKAIHG